MLSVTLERFALKRPFTIARGTKTHADVLSVVITRGAMRGRGECVPYARYGETIKSVTAQIKSLPQTFTQASLQDLLPCGAARNAVDCALWDLRAKSEGRAVWELARLPAPRPVLTAFTLSLGPPSAMRREAAANAHRPLLKVKLGTPHDLARLRAVREGAPHARLILDANEGWDVYSYSALLPELVTLGVALVEQPLPAGEDEALRVLARPIPICADESAHDAKSLPALRGKYDFVNIKLDKTGGLSEAIKTMHDAREMGFGVMIGCMVGSSLAMAPALLLAQGAGFIDLDGPLLLAQDRETPLRYDAEGLHPPSKLLWG